MPPRQLDAAACHSLIHYSIIHLMDFATRVFFASAEVENEEIYEGSLLFSSGSP